MKNVINLLHEILGTTTKIALVVKIIVILLFVFCCWMCIHYYIQHYPAAEVTSMPFDYNGMLVGFFTLLVTLLVGWNIYSTINAKDELEQYKSKFDEILNIEEENKNINSNIKEIYKTIEINFNNSKRYSKSLYELEQAKNQLAIFHLYATFRLALKCSNEQLPLKTEMLDKSLANISKSISIINNNSKISDNRNDIYAFLISVIGNIKDYSQLENISASTYSAIIEEISNDDEANTLKLKEKLIRELSDMKILSERLQEVR